MTTELGTFVQKTFRTLDLILWPSRTKVSILPPPQSADKDNNTDLRKQNAFKKRSSNLYDSLPKNV